jgi:Single-strand binding protein family.
MIKCNVNVIGKVYRPVELKEDRNGNPFVTFGISVELKDKQESKSIDISVASDGEDNSVLSLKSGDRVKITGVLTFRKRDDTVYYNFSADKVQKIGQEEDSISGTILFKGTMGNKDIQECRGKKGAFRVFDAYSSEKVDADKFAFIWVHFIDFSEECPGWLVPRAKIEAEGALEFQVFNGKVSIGCRVESLAPWKMDNA